MHWTPLSPEQRDAFDRDGFLIIRNAIDADTIARLIAAGDRLVASDRIADRQRSNDRYDGFRNAVALDPALEPVLTWGATVPLVAQLMGPHLQLHTSHLIWKHADPAGTPDTHRDPGWHRDVATLTRDIPDARMPRVEIKVMYYLTPCAGPYHGQTRFVPGSHRTPYRPDGSDPPGAVEPLLNAGDAVLFENRTLHAAGPNRSGRTRKTLVFGYSHRWMRPDDYLVQSAELLARLDPVGRALVDASGLNHAANGAFRPCGEASAFERLAESHGCTAAACQ